ncbi:MAG TPA: hypothetical protein VGX21_22590 [Methylomirabilota bacterium]|jgi:hypothetical protein|nr:hypothetical protein [Methylomirabilota bacterium]
MSNWALVVLTFALVLITGYYAWQTRRMVEEMRRQDRPYVALLLTSHHEASDRDMVISNLGTRFAVAIAITVTNDAKVLVHTPDEGVQRENVSSLLPGGVIAQSLAPGQSNRIAFVQILTPEVERQRLAYKISYRDGAGTRYEEDLELDYWF